MFDDWAELRAKRRQLDQSIERWLEEMPAAFAGYNMRDSNRQGVQRQHSAWQAMSHLFNHQTHHRGQVTTLLMQGGVDVGQTDLIALLGPAVPA